MAGITIKNDNAEGIERIVHKNIQKSKEMEALHAFIQKQFKGNHLDRSWTISIEFYDDTHQKESEEKQQEEFDAFDEYEDDFDDFDDEEIDDNEEDMEDD